MPALQTGASSSSATLVARDSETDLISLWHWKWKHLKIQHIAARGSEAIIAEAAHLAQHKGRKTFTVRESIDACWRRHFRP